MILSLPANEVAYLMRPDDGGIPLDSSVSEVWTWWGGSYGYSA